MHCARTKVGVFLPAWLPILGLWMAAQVASPMAYAGSGKTFLQTMGISIAVGTVLGASTLPFYDQPGDHFGNLATGAAVGGLVGVGILVYGLFQGSDDAVSYQYRRTPPSELQVASSATLRRPVNHNAIWTPLVSLTW